MRDADKAINIGSIDRGARSPFLDIDILVRAARDTGAQAIHPGYGYLSENPDFASRAAEAGLIFIGPSPSAMSTLGDKRSSKAYLKGHAPDVPLIPGFAGSDQDPEALGKAASGIGFPVMLKASAGGGGKGMRIVREAEQLQHELERAQSEARRSFGQSDCILEKYIESSKHVEIQIMGDSHGEVISLFDRDCSVQRRHQKVIEETPCTFLMEETRKEMCATAVRIAKLIGYANAGTVEFVVDIQTNRFYFLEVNARLQVEHPITEEVTGLDLVSLQLFVAAGGSLRSIPAVQDITQRGHAIECRLCAEDPQREFFPEHGDVHLWRPADGSLGPGRDVRYETAIETGSSVSIYFDSMIAKLIVWAPTRALAIEKTARALAHTACVGVKTNQLFIQSCLLHRAFRDPAYTTSLIPQHLAELLQPPLNTPKPSETMQALSIIPALAVRKLADYGVAAPHQKPFNSVRRQFRNQRFDPVSIHCDIVTISDWPHKTSEGAGSAAQLMCLWKSQESPASADADQVFVRPVPQSRPTEDETASAASKATAQYNEISQALRAGTLAPTQSYRVQVDSWRPIGQPLERRGSRVFTVEVSLNERKILAHVAIPSSRSHTQVGRAKRIFCHFPVLGTFVEFGIDSLLSFSESLRSIAGTKGGAEEKVVTAPMPCKVLSVLKKSGDEVKSGDSVMVIESMKMEVNITVPSSGKFQTDFKQGDAVEEGKVLCLVV